MKKYQSSPEASKKHIFAHASFMWRNGKWHMHSDAAELPARALPLRLNNILNHMLNAGKLTEVSPGVFRLFAAAAHPLLDGAESPLQRLAMLKQPNGTALLDPAQIRAGEHLRRDYERAHLNARVTATYDASAGHRNGQARFSDNHIAALSDDVLAARDRVHLALEAVGPELSGILLHVCCMASGLEQAELQLSLPRRAGKAVMQLALTRLARHYGFMKVVHHAGPGKIGHWAVSDFKPVLATPPVHQP